MFDMRQALTWIDQALLFARGNEAMQGVSTDSRRIEPGCLYVPLRGERFDGHAFVDQAIRAGAGGYLFERQYADTPFDEAGKPCIRVADTRRALGELARGWRRTLSLPVLAVLGSNGKTTVKEMLAAVVREAVGADASLATQGNLNNDIGLPLTVLRLRASHRMAVLELGMNHPGEIAWLSRIAEPQVAVITNAQREHQEFMCSVEATALENGQAIASLPADGIAVFPGDDACTDIWMQLAGERRTVTFGFTGAAPACNVEAAPEASPARFTMSVCGESIDVTLPVEGRHNVRNALAAAATAHAAGIGAAAIARGLAGFSPARGRLERVEAGAGIWLVDDTYNANPDSVRAAIDVLAARPAPRVLVLGDMGELGPKAAQWHAEVGSYAREHGITALLGLGDLSLHAVQAFGTGGRHCTDRQAVIEAARGHLQAGVSMLIKGSRFMAMETIVRALLNSGETH